MDDRCTEIIYQQRFKGLHHLHLRMSRSAVRTGHLCVTRKLFDKVRCIIRHSRAALDASDEGHHLLSFPQRPRAACKGAEDALAGTVAACWTAALRSAINSAPRISS
jgi:hypothetical protein